MSPAQFDDLAERAITAKPDLFVDLEKETPPSDLTDTEYGYFLSRYGHGYFGYVLITPPRQIEGGLYPRAMLTFAEDGCGGYYCFRLEGEQRDGQVLYWYPDEADEPKIAYASFFDFVAEVGLSQIDLPQ